MPLRIDPDASAPTHAVTAMEHWIVGDLDDVIRDEVDAARSGAESAIGQTYNRARLMEIIAGRLRWVSVALETRDHMAGPCTDDGCETHALWQRLQTPEDPSDPQCPNCGHEKPDHNRHGCSWCGCTRSTYPVA